MAPFILLIILPLLLIGLVFFKPLYKEFKRKQVRGRPFPKTWRKILRDNVPYFYAMPADLQLQLKQHILVFLAEKQFYGFEGVQITDEIKVTIAAQACLLLLNRKTDYYPKLRSIYVYPAAFIAKHQAADAAGIHQQFERTLAGESWDLGKVVLSWKDTHRGGLVFNDGHNVVIHEFAHQLDQETGVANGAPYLPKAIQNSWPKILNQEFEALKQKAQRGEESLLDHYGATNPAEFFAVASEVFFEQPKALLQSHKKLYQHLQLFYRVNPAIW